MSNAAFCRVYNKQALRMLVAENTLEEEAREKRAKQRAETRKSLQSNGSASMARSSLVASKSEREMRDKERADVRYERFKMAQEIRQKAEKADKEARAEEAVKKKEAQFKYWNGRVNDPVEKKQVAEVCNWLDRYDEEKGDKLRKLHEKWNEEVYSKIKTYINETLDTRDHIAYKETVRREFQNYVDLTNKKGTVFRDIYVESEYDPFVISRETIKFKTKKFNDPVKRLLEKRKEELGQVKGGFLNLYDKEGGRETLDVELWQTGKIENTPHGLAAKFGEPPRPKTEIELKNGRSRVVIDHFNVLKGKAGQRQLDAELGPGKRSIPGRGGSTLHLG
mgnify:FL=1|jgi:hypothetical protein